MARYGEILLQENPRRRRRSRRNPSMNPFPKVPKSVGGFFQGVKPMDAALALGGFAGATMLPGVFIKETTTTGQKFGKFALALVSTGVVGMAAKSVGGLSGAQAAVAGGLAGALAQGLSMMGWAQIGGKNRMLASGPRRLGTSTVVSPSMTREGETVSLITP